MSEIVGTGVYYLSIPVESADQATSLARYLNAHGVEASGDGPDEVVCPIDSSEPRQLSLISTLHQHWRLFWENSDSELYGLPVYVKSGHCAECP